MASLWFLAGVLFTLAVAILLLPWLRTIPGLAARLPVLPWQAGAVALLTLAAIIGLHRWSDTGDRDVEPRAAVTAAAPAATHPATPAATSATSAAARTKADADTWNDIARNLGSSASSGSGSSMTAASPMAAGATGKSAAEPMGAAVASLQRRLAKGGGNADDWELLAKSYEFLHRPDDAAKARAHQLPPLPDGEAATDKVLR
jgi:hypothetical protein